MRESYVDPIELMSAQHRHLGELLREVDLAENGEDRGLWLRDFARELELAARLEETLHLALLSAETRTLLEEAAAERVVMRWLAADLELGETVGDAFADLLANLQGLFRGHVARQEGELYPLLRVRLSADELRASADRMSAVQGGLEGVGRGKDFEILAGRLALS